MALDNDLTQAVRSGGGDIVLEFGRPDLRKLLEEELAASDGRSVSVDGEPYFPIVTMSIVPYADSIFLPGLHSVWARPARWLSKERPSDLIFRIPGSGPSWWPQCYPSY